MLTSQQLVALRQQISEARNAYHMLQIGRSARVVVDQNGERVEFTAANSSRLYTYIMQLEAQLPCAAGTGTAPVNGPAGFFF